MNKKISFALALFSLVCFAAPAQNILQDYFHGNKDSMLAEAMRLIRRPDPVFQTAPAPAQAHASNVRSKSSDFTAADGKRLFAYHLPAKSACTIVLLHGVKSTADDYLAMAAGLQKATRAELYAVDLRGHGKSGGSDADVSYIDQYIDDLSGIIHDLRLRKPKNKIVLAGHSMGGGVVLRYAMRKNAEKVDGYLLVSPLLGQNSPAIRSAAAPAGSNEEPFMKIHFPRIIGLKMLNEIGDHSHDSLPVLFFNLPEKSPMRAYSYRANQSMAPENYREGLKSIHAPLLVLIGSKDEAFSAEATKKAVEENSGGHVEIIEGETHDGITQHPALYMRVEKWLQAL